MKKVFLVFAALFIVFSFVGFATADPFSYTATDTPIPIPDVNTITSTINVSDIGIINDLDVYVGLDHTWVGDLFISLLHNAVTVTLFDHNDGNGDNIYTTFDDEAASSIIARRRLTRGRFDRSCPSAHSTEVRLQAHGH